MAREHQYAVTVRWTGNTGTGTATYRSYERAHEISAEGKPAIAASSDPVFRGDKARWNPEELLLAALSGCHQLAYLHLCAVAGIVVEPLDITACSGQTCQALANNGPDVLNWATSAIAVAKVCTHAGCAVSLFNVLSMQLICPCHQSTFNILEDAAPVFGPASRPLPQLPLGVRADGYLIARSDYIEPIGPGFWNRAGD